MALGIDETKGRVLGYTANPNPQAHVKALYFHGAEFVYWDQPDQTNVLRRKNLSLLMRVARKGDIIILNNLSDLGRRKASQDRVLSKLDALGVGAQDLIMKVLNV